MMYNDDDYYKLYVGCPMILLTKLCKTLTHLTVTALFTIYNIPSKLSWT